MQLLENWLNELIRTEDDDIEKKECEMKRSLVLLIVVVLLGGLVSACAASPKEGSGAVYGPVWTRSVTLMSGEKVYTSGEDFTPVTGKVPEGEAIMPGTEITEYYILFKDDTQFLFLLRIEDQEIWGGYLARIGYCYKFLWQEDGYDRRIVEPGTLSSIPCKK